MGYKFGQLKNKIDVLIEDKTFGIKVSNELTTILQEFSARAEELKAQKEPNFDEIERLCLDFLFDVFGEEQLDEIIALADENNRNAFEYMNLTNYVMEEISRQSKEITEVVRKESGAVAPKVVRNRRR